MSILLKGTAAALLRDGLYKAISGGSIKKSEITERIKSIYLPSWLQSEILQMAKYRELDRITDPVEQILEDEVHRRIITEIISNPNNYE